MCFVGVRREAGLLVKGGYAGEVVAGELVPEVVGGNEV